MKIGDKVIKEIIITTYGYVAIYKNFNGQMFSPFIRLVKPEPFILLQDYLQLSKNG